MVCTPWILRLVLIGRSTSIRRIAKLTGGVMLLATLMPRPVAGDEAATKDAPQEGPQPVKVARALADPPQILKPTDLAKNVRIYRDRHGVPHIFGKTDECVAFGFAYAQAEDFFWQVEDNYILALGRYSEVHGARGLNSDLLNRAFEVTRRSRKEFGQLDDEIRSLLTAFSQGLNYYLEKHPEVQPRLIERFEPWHVLAFGRHVGIELCYRYTRLSNQHLPRMNSRIWAATGSNAWAISGERTKSGNAMLLANPHLPWYGVAQLYEAHVSSSEGWNFTGSTFLGSPILTIGHNDHLGWSMTTNEPDIADAWRVTFDDPEHPLRYRYDNGYRTATEWKETIKIKSSRSMKEKSFTFRKTHHGPVVGKEDDQTYLAARIAGIYKAVPLRQALRMTKATNLAEFRAALAMLQIPIMNIIYADRAGNIFFLYGGIVPRRDPNFDWSKPVDGSDPRTAWRGYHTLSELPQVLNPASGFIQNCNSTPFTTTDWDNPDRAAFPPYMIEDKDDDKRRAKRSREILRQMTDVTLEQFQKAAFDTTIYWAKHELPKYSAKFEGIKATDVKLALQVQPLLDHLLDWDCRVTVGSTQASLCEAWYEALYGTDYPGETLKKSLADSPRKQFEALVSAASRLAAMHGTWKVPYGEIHRIQRQPYESDLLKLRFADDQPSLPTVGAHGPMGVVFTQYYTPSIKIPLVMSQKKRYAVVGASYLAAYEFGIEGIRGASLVPYGQTGQPDSPHYFDQAHMLSEMKLKPILFKHRDVVAQAVRAYHPGDETSLVSSSGP